MYLTLDPKQHGSTDQSTYPGPAPVENQTQSRLQASMSVGPVEMYQFLRSRRRRRQRRGGGGRDKEVEVEVDVAMAMLSAFRRYCNIAMCNHVPFISEIIFESFISFSKLLTIFVCDFMKYEVSGIKIQS